MLSDKRRVVLHHSATVDGETFSWAAIRRYHTATLGWRDIGYHFGVELVGDPFGSHQEIMVGRMLAEDAAAVKEKHMNKLGVHICVVGNFDLAPPPPAQYQLTLKLVRSLLGILRLEPGDVDFHRTYATYKSCPGKKFPSLAQVRFDLT